ncbi:MAG: carbamoyltransferase HypF [Candidatus Binatia bacterium]
METRAQIRVRGIVQGVGFRPFVFRKAKERALKGHVLNNSTGVLIDVEGEPNAIEQLIDDLKSNPPPLSQIESIACTGDLPAANFPDFRILRSSVETEKSLPVSADAATCDACLQEMFDSQDRRHRYPLINCTHCGPRFTIIEAVPYDRARTTMRDFAMCSDCAAEYKDPRDRRFHAEPVACPSCGPQIFLKMGRAPDWTRGAGSGEQAAGGGDALSGALRALESGKIVAIKGIGGFHLACDALNGEAVVQLRKKKHREEKPFALMANSLPMIRRYCYVSETEAKLLVSSRRPIVLLKKKPDCEIPPAVAPGVDTLGFMLPYTPLHHLIFRDLERPLIMTSGNLSDEPIAYEDEEAVARLGQIADCFLLHNRRIHMRADDSVVRAFAGGEMVLRRSRGYAPEPIGTAMKFENEILACGAHLKSTFCIARDHHVFVSHHIGDLENYETYRSFAGGIEHFKRLFALRPVVVAHDLHPAYLSTRYAMELDNEIKIGVQHHHAHVASCMAEHGLQGPVLGVVFDGLGYGEDGAIWGGEFLIARFASCRRYAHFRYIPLAGGDTAIRQPWRSAFSYLADSFASPPDNLRFPWWQPAPARELRTLAAMLRNGVNTISTSSCGRLFDAISSMLGVRHEIRYEAQAAIELETIASPGIDESYPFDIDTHVSPWEIDFRSTIQRIARERESGAHVGLISARFHNTVAKVIGELCRRMREEEGLNQVCLSGGTFQNVYLLERAIAGLEALGFNVFYPSKVPPNDGGISLGQAAIANERIRRGG